MLHAMTEMSRTLQRAITLLDSSRSLSDALCEVIMASAPQSDRTQPLDLSRTRVLVPGGRLARAIERGLLARAQTAHTPMFAPTVVTPIMLASRFVVATAPTLGGIATRVSWRATIDQALDAKTALSKGVRDLFGIREDAEVSSALRENIAKRLLRCARETASAMHSFADVAAAITERDGETSTNAPLQQRWNTLVQLEAIREKLLLRAAVVDRDEAFRDAVKTGRIAHEAFDRVVVLFADPEPVHRALLALLEKRGVQIEVCVHTHESIDGDGFPHSHIWCTHAFDSAAIPSSSIRTAQGPLDAGEKVIDAIRAIPSPRTSDSISVMAPNDETQQSIERALLVHDVRAVGGDARAFGATRLGTLLARLRDLFAEGSAESLAAFVRHPDVSRTIALHAAAPALDTAALESALAEYRVATRVSRWIDEVASKAHGAKEFGELRKVVRARVITLEGTKNASDWAQPIRAVLSAFITDAPLGTRDELLARRDHDELRRSVTLLDRALAELASVPELFATSMSSHEAIAYLLGELAHAEVRGESIDDGMTIVGWLDAGISDERHIILAGFCDGDVPEGSSHDSLLPDELRQTLGVLSSARRAARDAWILDGMITRASRRASASLSFVVPRRTATGDPTRPSRFLLSVSQKDLPARVEHLFPQEQVVSAVVTRDAARISARFDPTPTIALPAAGSAGCIESISVTAFATYLKCPYLFQLQSDPRLKLQSRDEQGIELDPGAFGTLVHSALERWGKREMTRAAATTDRATIARELNEALDALVAENFPSSTSPAVKVQWVLARRRLEAFARLQAKQAADGWKVHAVELSFKVKPNEHQKQAPKFPDANGLWLVGKIDRVDKRGELEYCAWDYKTSSKAVKPKQAHLRGRGAKGDEPKQWKNLQLPLYRELLASMGIGACGLGYINLAPNALHSSFELLGLDDAVLQVAHEVAVSVVASVQGGEFMPSGKLPVRTDDAFARIWQQGMQVDDTAESDADANADNDAEGLEDESDDLASSTGGDE